jgi:cation transport ATPase
MVTSAIAPPRVLSLLPGRARVHLPAWSGNSPDDVESYLRRMDGLREARANPRTGNILVRFDPQELSADRVLSELSALQAAWCAADSPEQLPEACSASAAQTVSGKSAVARALVGGTLGHAALDTVFYTGTAAAVTVGWTWAASLAAVHLVLDVFIWGIALRPVAQHFRRLPGPSGL